MSDSLHIFVNDEQRTIDAGTTVATLIASYALEPRRVAVEVNRDLVPRKQYADAVLHDGDRVEIVTLVGGG